MFVLVLVILGLIRFMDGNVSDYGEACNYTAECIDHRMICTADETTAGMCLCDRFHEWKGPSLGCAQKYNLTTIMEMVVYIRDTSAFARNLERIFFGQKVAGIFVLCVCALTTVAVMLYCCYIKKTDKELKEDLNRMRNTTKSRISTHKINISHL